MSKKPSKPDQDKEIIGPTTRTITIEHVLGEQTIIQKLSIPRRRPFKNVFQLKCTLLGTKPPVWRRLQVPESYTFYDLHVAIQDVMAWLDYGQGDLAHILTAIVSAAVLGILLLPATRRHFRNR